MGLVGMPPFNERSPHAGNILFPDVKDTTHWVAVMDSNDSPRSGFRKPASKGRKSSACLR